MRVLSLFDGMSCGQIALRELYCPKCRDQKQRKERPAAYLKFKGTPGPWHVSKNHKEQVRADINIPIARVHSMLLPSEIKANARLIAASPELLEAAKKMITDISDAGVDQDWPEYDALRAAVNKALGNE